MIQKIITNKCPNCGKGHVYKEKNIYFNFKKPKMNKECDHCGYVFEKEPGFFFGAMYVSYALGIAEAIAVFIIGTFFFESTFDLRILPWIIITILAFSSFNVRIARIIWIYLLKGI
ncbi:DUF983 domain-containing protein [Aquimarina litoralis]|uniref:DUF983 domain-containing protein n=1 Tax=Aquimarina litoralis TaxID=584605 RepID=UPI001C5A4705|nr:DUF983 domain-containing protein [Aquimarina litoralis]MBW1298575.1 DUF983 domain-containing protein [Aquimarina litoralis]